jgi:FKBP-type peptidyl-prolyl cis-trans isomerase
MRVAYTVVDGANGTTVDSYGYEDGQDVTWAADAEQLLTGFAKSIGCATVGSRIVAVIPAAEAFGAEGYPDLGIGAGDSLVLVVDVQAVQPTRAWGEDQPPVDGFPTVTLDDDGTPTVEIPDADPPTDLQVAVLKKGDGAVVQATDTISLQYLGVAWDTGEVFDQSWPTPTSFPLQNLVPGFTQGVTGQTVGSQVLVVIPPALAYGEASDTNTSQLAGKTLVFVVDILGATPAA